MDIERSLSLEPTDREFEKLGYDIESHVPGTGKLRFILTVIATCATPDDERNYGVEGGG